MSRGVKDLRELICVSRLSIVESDDECQPDYNDEDERCYSAGAINGNNSGNLFTREGCLSDQMINGSVKRSVGVQKDRPGASGEVVFNDLELSSASYSFLCARKKRNKRHSKSHHVSVPESPTTNHKFPTKPHLPPVPAENWGTVALVPGSSRPRENVRSSHVPISKLSDLPNGNFDTLLEFIDEAVVSEWLESANKSLVDISSWCRIEANFVHFAHYWLTELEEERKVEILSTEHRRLMDQLDVAFSAGDGPQTSPKELSGLLSSVLREYPDKVLGSKGARLFLEYLDILTSDRHDESYRLMLSDVRCATVVRRFAQYILATRSFALVSMWTAVLDSYRKLQQDSKAINTSVSTNNADLNQERMYQAVSYGFVDVMQYFLQSGRLSPKMRDVNNKSLVFYAVVHNQPAVLEFLLTRVLRGVDVNEPADSGNTPLHAAANVGSTVLVGILLSAHNIDVDARNPNCDDATPLHLAVMHGHTKVVRQLLSAGADPQLKMGAMVALDVAKSFNHEDIKNILENPSTSVHDKDSQTPSSVKNT